MNKIEEILSWYNSENAGVRANLYRILNHGKLAGTGHMLLLPADQGFEHGPARSFMHNPDAYNPRYHIQLAIDAGCNAYVAPLGFLEAVAADYAGQIPCVLKLNGRDSLHDDPDPMPSQTATVEDALRLGCSAVGYVIYPGTNNRRILYENFREVIRQAKSYGLPVFCWAFPRGSDIDEKKAAAVDISAYAAHLAAQMGAHIIYMRLPIEQIAREKEMGFLYKMYDVPLSTVEDRVRHIVQATFAGRRLLLFSGGPRSEIDILLKEAQGIRDGGAAGQMIGRNAFQRPREEALALLEEIIRVYKAE
jgi:fructose-bisphosphate aldolase, class I